MTGNQWLTPIGSTLIVILGLLAISCQAQESVLPPPEHTGSSRLFIEGAFQIQSVAGPSSPWMGVGASIHLFEPFSLGLRGFAPVAQTVDHSVYAIQAPLRVRLWHGENTDFIVEGEYSENFYNFIPFNSYGFALGADYRWRPGLSFGILGGIEVARVVIDSVGLENENNAVVYPKIALMVDLGL